MTPPVSVSESGDKNDVYPRHFLSSISSSSWFTLIAAGATLLLAAYWAVFVLVTPVTVYDSHTYNLARLMLAEHGGMFADGIWNTQRQVIFPWSFDAIHYPFLKLVRGFGVALPSFMCMVGTCKWRS